MDEYEFGSSIQNYWNETENAQELSITVITAANGSRHKFKKERERDRIGYSLCV